MSRKQSLPQPTGADRKADPGAGETAVVTTRLDMALVDIPLGGVVPGLPQLDIMRLAAAGEPNPAALEQVRKHMLTHPELDAD